MNTENNHLMKFKSLLEQKKAELCQTTGQRDDIAVERIAGEIDAAMQASEREFAVRKHDRQSLLLRNVEAALHRIESGEFGICIHCEEEIRQSRAPQASHLSGCRDRAQRLAMPVD